MHKSILITGLTGSGKSTVCRKLKKIGYKAYNVEEMSGLFKMTDKGTGKRVIDSDHDNLEAVKRHNWNCDKDKLRWLLRNNLKGIVFYCGTGSNIDDLPSLFDKTFLLKANEKTLSKRLNARNRYGRTPEVQRWIFQGKKSYEDRLCKKGATVINANRTVSKIAADIIKRSKSLR